MREQAERLEVQVPKWCRFSAAEERGESGIDILM